MSYIGKKPVDFNDVTEAQTFEVTGDLTVDTNTLHVDSTNNNVGFGTVSPAAPVDSVANTNGVSMRVRARSSDEFGLIEFVENDGSTAHGYIGTPAADTLAFYTNGLNERLRILSSGGLTFNGDTATANALDDYEEGTWTPTAVSNIDAISSVDGHYTKIGNLVTVIYIATIDPTSTSSNMLMGGLPYPVTDLLSGTGVQGTGVVFEDNTMFMSIAIEASSNIQIELDRPIQGTASALQRIYRGSLSYFTT